MTGLNEDKKLISTHIFQKKCWQASRDVIITDLNGVFSSFKNKVKILMSKLR